MKTKKLKKGNYRIVMMCCGYVESSMTSWLIFSTMDKSKRFETARDAVVELALDLYAKYDDELSYSRKAIGRCCQDTQALNKEAAYCMTCGNRFESNEFDELGFCEFVRDLHVRNCDAFGESEYANDRELVFWPWRSEEIIRAAEDEIVLISENAEGVILSALYESKPELRDPDLESECACDDDWVKVKTKSTNHST